MVNKKTGKKTGKTMVNRKIKQERQGGECGIGKSGTDFGEATMFQVVQ